MDRRVRERAPKLALGLALTCAGGLGCKPAPDEPLGPLDSYVLLMPNKAAGADVLVRTLATTDQNGALARELMAGFGSELLRTAYMARQYVRQAKGDAGKPRFSEEARRRANDAVTLVLGRDLDGAPGQGMTLSGSWLGGPVLRPEALWIGLPADLDDDRALSQTVAGRMAAYLGRLADTAGRLDAKGDQEVPLVRGYRMAMEVIAREWRFGEGPRGTLAPEAGTELQRKLFADVRSNGFVRDEAGALRPAAEIAIDAGVAATVMYRMFQSPKLSKVIAPAEFYQPFASEMIPEGISPAVVLGTFRNLQAKLLGVWATAAAAGRGPRDIIDLVSLYADHFPGERSEVLRVFLVTTFGATAKAGGVSMDAADARQSLAELTVLAAEVAAKRRTLRAGMDDPANL